MTTGSNGQTYRPQPPTIAPDEHGARGVGVVAQAELTALVNQIADYNGFTPEQRQEALEIALADPVTALECFRVLAERDGITTVH